MAQEFLFRGIQKQEWTNLFSFIQAKRIRIENLEEAQQGPGGNNTSLDFSGLDLGEDIDTGPLFLLEHSLKEKPLGNYRLLDNRGGLAASRLLAAAIHIQISGQGLIR